MSQKMLRGVKERAERTAGPDGRRFKRRSARRFEASTMKAA
jgi:hypothetical protein